MQHSVQSKPQISPCPKCGSMLLARGVPVSVSTPRILRRLYGAGGVTCTGCGYHAMSIQRWNKASEAAPVRRAPPMAEPRYSGVTLYAFGEDGAVRQERQVPNATLGAMAIWSYMERKYLPMHRPPCLLDKPWYRENMTDDELIAAYGYRPSRLTNQAPHYMQEIFDLTGRPDIPEGERLVLETTIDKRLLHGTDIPAAIEAFRAFPADSNLPEQANVLEDFLRWGRIVAVGWRQSPIHGIDWAHVSTPAPGIVDGNMPSYNCVSGQFHVWIERSGKKDSQ